MQHYRMSQTSLEGGGTGEKMIDKTTFGSALLWVSRYADGLKVGV